MNTIKRIQSNLSVKKRKRQRTQARLNPWKDSFELDACGQQLLLAAVSNEIMDNRKSIYHALQLVQTWQLRSNEKLPHAVDTTYSLANVLWRDCCCASCDDGQPEHLRPVYAMALIRGINGLADILQQQRAMAGSVATLCAELGIPGWLVDLRHDASHNDLPSLPTLRLAAQTFLSFLGERFWNPLHEAHVTQRKEAIHILMEYEAAAAKNVTVESNPTALVEEVLVQSQENGGDDDDKDDDDSSSDEDPTALDLLWGKNCGKTVNRFAALEEPKKVKKVVKELPNKRVKRKEAVVATPNNNNSLLDLAQQYVRNVPMDVGLYVALSFLIWGSVGDVPPPGRRRRRGALVPDESIGSSSSTFPATPHSVDQIRQQYKPLLFVLSQAWPGFMHALLVHLVDCCLSMEVTISEHATTTMMTMDAEDIRTLYFLSSWIRFALSRDFHRCHDRSLSIMNHGTDETDLGKKAVSTWTVKERAFMESPAPLHILLACSFPLNSLSDRCRECQGTTSQEVAALFDNVLGHERSHNFGVGERSPSEEANRTVALQEVDTHLSCGEAHPTEESASAPTDRVTIVRPFLGWTQCLSWDPCAIGSLPGRPV